MNRDELMNELQEQARLLGMGAERELALKAKVDRLERVNAELLEALELADAMLSGANMNASVVEKKVRAAIAKARGEV